MSEPEIDFLREDEAVTPALEETPEQPAAPVETVATPEPPAPEVPTTPEPHEERVPKAALIAERRKRQEYEARLRQLEQQAQPAQPQNFYEAPDQYVHAALARQSQHFTQVMVGALEAQAREIYPDFDEVIEALVEQADSNPLIVGQIQSSPNPAITAYKLGKQLREMQAMKDPDAYRAKIEAEVRAKIEAEQRAKDAARQAIPPNLADARASKDSEVLPDDSLDSILNSRKR